MLVTGDEQHVNAFSDVSHDQQIQHLSSTYLAHQELESIITMVIIIIRDPKCRQNKLKECRTTSYLT